MTQNTQLSRRQAVGRAGLLVSGAWAGSQASAADVSPARPAPDSPFLFCLNLSTIRGQKLGLVKEIEVAAEAGYQAIEPWIARADGALYAAKHAGRNRTVFAPSAGPPITRTLDTQSS